MFIQKKKNIRKDFTCKDVRFHAVLCTHTSDVNEDGLSETVWLTYLHYHWG